MSTTNTKAEWVKSEDAGYRPGKMMLDAATGHYSVYRGNGRSWICAHVVNGVCRNSTTHTTRRDAMAHAEEAVS
jgi:hypothetical protein